MNLNLQIIASDLRMPFLQEHFYTSYAERELNFVSIYLQDCVLRPDILYIVYAGQRITIAPSGNTLSLIFIGEPESYPAHSNYIAVDTSVNPADLLLRIQEIFLKYEKWVFSLQSAVINGKDLKEIGQLSLDIFENPIQLFNQTTLNCVFSVTDSSGYSLPDSFPSIDENGYMDSDLLITLKIENIMSTIASEPVLIHNERLPLLALMYDILINNSQICRIIIFQVNKSLDERDKSLMLIFAYHIEQMLLHSPALSRDHSQFVDRTLLCLVSGKTVEKEAVQSMLQILNWTAHHEFFCLIAESFGGRTDGCSLYQYATTIRKYISNSCYIIAENRIVFIFNLTLSQKSREEVLKLLLPVLRDFLLKAGISARFHDFCKIHNYVLQASIALEIGLQEKPYFWFFRFENYALSYLDRLFCKDFDPYILYPECLVNLIEYDKRKNTGYVHILRIWLMCNMNITETAKALYMHRNTLLYKLDRIKEILGDALNDYDTRLLVMLALRITENLQNQDLDK